VALKCWLQSRFQIEDYVANLRHKRHESLTIKSVFVELFAKLFLFHLSAVKFLRCRVQGCQNFQSLTYHNWKIYTKWLQNMCTNWPQTTPIGSKIQDGHKIHRNFSFQDLQNVSKLVFLVCKYTIWQPWSSYPKTSARAIFNTFARARFCPTNFKRSCFLFREKMWVGAFGFMQKI
jgi:hypothetical protein